MFAQIDRTMIMRNIINKKTFEDSIIHYILIALFCMNFLGRGSFFCLIFAIFAAIRMPRKIMFDGCALCTLLLTLSVLFISITSSDITEAVKSLNYFLMYLIGLNGYYASENKMNYIKRSVFSIYFGYMLLVLLTFFGNLNEVRILGQRAIKNIWTGEYVAVTLIGLLSSVIIGYFFYSFFCQKSKLLKLLGLFSLISVFLVNAQTATRTPIILFFVNIAIMSLIYLVNQKGLRTLRTITVFACIVAVIAIIISFDIGGIRTYIENTPLFERFQNEGTETSRIDIAKEHFKYMFDYPFGGSNISSVTGYTPHNFLQQGYDLYGAIAGISLLIIFFCFVRNILCLLKISEKEGVDYLLISLYLSMIIQAFLEPVFTGYPCFLFSLLLIHGIATGYLNSRKTDF